jgi:long-chain acyl-CoA synthetase
MADSVFGIFMETCEKSGGKVAAQYKVAGAWRDVTWNEMRSIALKAGAALMKHGLEPKQHVSILSNTRLEWILADLGIQSTGAATVPIYQSNLAEECEYIINDSGAVFVFAEDGEQLEKLREVRDQIPDVKKVICFTAKDVDDDSDWEMSWDELLEEGAEHLKENEDALMERANAVGPEDLLTLIYTSGTTGKPKGVMITHDCMRYEAEASRKINLISPDDVQYLWMPMAHVFAKILEVIWFSEAHVMAFWEGDLKKIVPNLSEVRPTVMCSVPRIFEKVHASVTGKVKEAGGVKGALGRWALQKGDEAARLEAAGKDNSSMGWSLAQKLVWSKLHDTLNETFGGRMRFFISGGAPLSTDIAYFFKYAGFKVCEGYGLTETSAATTVNRVDDIRIGTVGQAMPGTELKIASDGEILIRGRGVMAGYWNREDATKEVLEEDGWFHSGDIGELDNDGFLKITDRKKDIIVTAGGKNVAPQNIEGLIKAKSPLISQVVVHGDKRKFLSAVITVDPETVEAWAQGKGLSGDHKTLSQNTDLRSEIENVVKDANGQLASYEGIKKFEILDHDFEIGDQLTASLKVKRKVCNDRYQEIFNGFYE